MNVLEWMDSLEAFQVIIYRRPNFLSPDFEFESYIGSGELRNIFHEKRVDDTKESITLVFPERWINCSECHQLFPLLQKYYPSEEIDGEDSRSAYHHERSSKA